MAFFRSIDKEKKLDECKSVFEKKLEHPIDRYATLPNGLLAIKKKSESFIEFWSFEQKKPECVNKIFLPFDYCGPFIALSNEILIIESVGILYFIDIRNKQEMDSINIHELLMRNPAHNYQYHITIHFALDNNYLFCIGPSSTIIINLEKKSILAFLNTNKGYMSPGYLIADPLPEPYVWIEQSPIDGSVWNKNSKKMVFWIDVNGNQSKYVAPFNSGNLLAVAQGTKMQELNFDKNKNSKNFSLLRCLCDKIAGYPSVVLLDDNHYISSFYNQTFFKLISIKDKKEIAFTECSFQPNRFIRLADGKIVYFNQEKNQIGLIDYPQTQQFLEDCKRIENTMHSIFLNLTNLAVDTINLIKQYDDTSIERGRLLARLTDNERDRFFSISPDQKQFILKEETKSTNNCIIC